MASTLTNQNFRTRFHWQCDYLLGFQVPQKKNNSILEKRWPRNELDEKDDPYVALTIASNKEMDQLVEANTITSKVEKEDFTTCTNVGMTELDDEEDNMIPEPQSPEENMIDEEEESLESTTPRIETDSNDVSSTAREVGFAQYVHHK